MMEYKGYVGLVVFDSDARVFHGEVVGLRDVITFQGTSVAELERAFRDSINDYLAFCKERGESPEKPYSGQFVLRIDADLHRQAAMQAELSGVSLNAWAADSIARRVEHERDHAKPRTKRKSTRRRSAARR